MDVVEDKEVKEFLLKVFTVDMMETANKINSGELEVY